MKLTPGITYTAILNPRFTFNLVFAIFLEMHLFNYFSAALNLPMLRALGLSSLILFLLISCDQAEQQGRLFIDLLQSRLTVSGDWVRVADVYPGDWTHVCVRQSDSLGGHVNHQVLRQLFNLPPKTPLDLPFGTVSTSDWNWGITFFTPPNRFESLSIPTDQILGYAFKNVHQDFDACVRNSEAAFLRYETFHLDGSVQPYLLLIPIISIDNFMQTTADTNHRVWIKYLKRKGTSK